MYVCQVGGLRPNVYSESYPLYIHGNVKIGGFGIIFLWESYVDENQKYIHLWRMLFGGSQANNFTCNWEM
jgi:hypothetical protein